MFAVVLLIAGCARAAALGGLAPDAGCTGDRAGAVASPAEIRWVAPDAARDRAELAAWCAPVGPAVFTEGGPRTGLPVDSVAIVSWNVHVGGGDIPRLVRDLRSGALTDGRPVRDFVLLLQEVHRTSAELPPAAVGRVPARVEEYPPAGDRLDILTVAEREGLALFYAPSMRNGPEDGGRAEDRGNAILSSLPLARPEALELPREAQRRVALAATLQARSSGGVAWELRLANAHFDTRSPGTRFWASLGAGRLRQARAIADAIPVDVPVVLAGDLNTWSLPFLEGALPTLRARFPQSPPPSELPTFRTRWGFSRHLDHFFARLPERWTARYVRLDDRYGSDHYPLLAWVRPQARSRPRASD